MLALRATVHRKGRLPIYGFLLACAGVLISMGAKLQLALLAISLVGASTLMYFFLGASRLSRRIRTLFADHVKLTSANEKLGMLALVGDDIRALLAAWVTDRQPPRIHWARFWERVGAPILFMATVLAVWILGMMHAGTASLNAQWNDQIVKTNLPLAQWFADTVLPLQPRQPALHEWIGLAIWSALALVTLVVPWQWHRGRPDRILLVVDDLDRCAPDEMLNVIESFRLLLDERAVQNRLQVLMLVDELVLDHAIAQKYRTMIAERAEASNEQGRLDHSNARHEVVTEQNEKLFACHLRMAGLSEKDIESVVGSLASRELNLLRRKRDDEEMARYEAERKETLTALEIAKQFERDAEIELSIVRDGLPRSKVEPRISGSPSSFFARVRTDSHPMPTPAAEADAKEANERILRDNERRSRLTPEQRIAENPGVIDTRDKAQADLERARAAAQPYEDELRDGQETLQPMPRIDESDVRFTSAEVEDLRRFVPAHFRKIGRRASPRAIRILLFKLQLCRLLLDLRYPGRPEATRSIRAILEAFEAASSKSDTASNDGEIVGIARQVI